MARNHLSILDVGHGNSAVLVDEKGVVVFDAGPGSALLEFLKLEGISRIDVVLLSHADQDHIAGLQGLIALVASGEFEIGKVRINTDSSKRSVVWDDLLYALNTQQHTGKIDFDIALTSKNSGEFDQGSISIEILAPSQYIAGKGAGSVDRKERRLTSNSQSVVFRLVKEGFPIALLTGDIDEVGFTNLLESHSDLHSSVLIFPHHGGLSGSAAVAASEFAKKLCAVVMPKTIVFSIGRGKFNTPHPHVIKAIREALPEVHICCTQLSQHCSSIIPSAVLGNLTGKFSAGQQGHKCCMGTMTVYLDNPITLLPDRASHRAFIHMFASSALCMLS